MDDTYEHAEHAATALDAYHNTLNWADDPQHRYNPEAAADLTRDLLTDLMHYATTYDVDFDHQLDLARQQHQLQTTNDPGHEYADYPNPVITHQQAQRIIAHLAGGSPEKQECAGESARLESTSTLSQAPRTTSQTTPVRRPGRF